MKVTITRAEYEALSAEEKSLYGPIENGAKYRLTEAQSLIDAERGRVDEYRENNRGLNTQVRQLTERLETVNPILAVVGDRTPEDIRASFDRLAALESGGITRPDDVASRIEAALNPLRTQVSTLSQTILQKDQALDDEKLIGALTSQGIAGGVDQTMIEEFVTAARAAGAKWKNGGVEFLDGQGVRKSGSDGAILTVASFIADLRERKPKYFAPNEGMDSEGRPYRREGSSGIKTVRRSEMGKYLKEIAAGTVMVVD